MLTMIEPEGSGKQRSILVCAEEALASPVEAYLSRTGHEVTIASVATGTAEALLKRLFPVSVGRGNSEIAAGPTFFHWPTYDTIVLQDLWPTEGRGGGLIPLGCALASADYYLQGNFGGQKIVLVTDPTYFELTGNANWERVIRLAYDSNGQIDFIPLVGTTAPDVLRRLAIGAERESSVAVEPRSSDDPDVQDFGFRTRKVIVPQLLEYVRSRADIAIVDDDDHTIDALAALFSCPFTVQERHAVQLLKITSDDSSIVAHRRFEQLTNDCAKMLREPSDCRMTVFVTDLLFDRVAWQGVSSARRSGIELIESLRARATELRARIAIVSLTGISAPAITTTSLHRGADAVVTKATKHAGAVQHARHVDDDVVFRLLLTIAFLCFQREYLRVRRSTPQEPLKSQRKLGQVLPSYAVSPHVRAEWEDTAYILDTRSLYGKQLPHEAKDSIRHILQRYGENRQ